MRKWVNSDNYRKCFYNWQYRLHASSCEWARNYPNWNTMELLAWTVHSYLNPYRNEFVTQKQPQRMTQLYDSLVQFSASLSIEVWIISYRLATDIAHNSTTGACHFVATSFLNELLFAFPARPTRKRIINTQSWELNHKHIRSNSEWIRN